VSFELRRGESLGLVGESGSGKTTVARLLLGLTEPDAGTIVLEGAPLHASGRKRIKTVRGRLQLVFQDPADSLNPVMKVQGIVAEPLSLMERSEAGAIAPQVTEALQLVFQDPADSLNPVMKVQGIVAEPLSLMERSEAGAIAPQVTEALQLVGLTEAQARRHPRELSGGQRQRVAIARALVTRPSLIACDEAVSSLDVSVRAQILNLLMDLQSRLGLSYLFISHDLSVVRHVCDSIIVMYAGEFVEVGPADAIFTAPQHPYTVALLSAIPVADPALARERARIRLEGDPPDLSEPMVGCPFRSRCWKAQDVCTEVAPALLEHAPGHASACHFPELQVADLAATNDAAAAPEA
jgi:oligopeptide/dipeptide ABC transporter ATP-binding protein